jgi:hypothetical protein
MCFDQKSAFAFAALGFFLSYYVKSRTNNTRLAVGVFWFFLMEFLQGFQYFFIDDCENPWNQFLTFLGFLHICYQPYFTHIINSSLTRNPNFLNQYNIILRMCLLGGTMLLSRYFLAEYIWTDSTQPVSSDYTDWAGNAPINGSCRTTEWLRGEKLCTYKGKYHLAWSVPFADVSYWVPSAAIHSFLMFSPFFIMKKNMIIQGFFLWLTGPYLASWVTPNLQEQASIWCFFSITQIAVMLLIIREQLLLTWGKDKKGPATSIHSTHANGASAPKKPAERRRSPRLARKNE